jgi:hypothetical protein
VFIATYLGSSQFWRGNIQKIRCQASNLYKDLFNAMDAFQMILLSPEIYLAHDAIEICTWRKKDFVHLPERMTGVF